MNASMADSHNLGGYYAPYTLGFRSHYLSLEACVRPEGLVSNLTTEHGAYRAAGYFCIEEFDDDHVAQYESERRAYAQALIDFDKTWSKLFTGKPRTEENQDGVTHEQFLRYVPSCVDRVDQWACS